ncbi:THAP domain-containing protein 3 [Nephila pilipes]|uniref:THAP domain-containing protein 3 n=1 Tax=Nephila pilipes TaxID=299642 RepID=A0A8X6NXY3_NEPPI|nr:THAP domain-containing protein 3 [Nephila pilipes]
MAYCAAYGCNNAKHKDECRSKTFFRFPFKDPFLVKAWVVKLRRKDFTPSLSSVVCSDHFEEHCFLYQPFTNRRQLKPSSVPTIFVYSKPSNERMLQNGQSSTSRKQIDLVHQNGNSTKIDFFHQDHTSPTSNYVHQNHNSTKIDFFYQDHNSSTSSYVHQDRTSPTIHYVHPDYKSPDI